MHPPSPLPDDPAPDDPPHGAALVRPYVPKALAGYSPTYQQGEALRQLREIANWLQSQISAAETSPQTGRSWQIARERAAYAAVLCALFLETEDDHGPQ